MRAKLISVCVAAALTGCAVGPNYKRPDVAAPPQFRAGESQPAQGSLGDTKWFDLFQDETLRGLIQESLKANYDIRIAAQRVLEAQGQLTATRSALFPQLDAVGGASREGLKSPIQSIASGLGSATWEIDLFGKLRRATEAARADLLSVQENQKAVMQALIAQVATAYFNLREADAELVYVRESIKTRQESVNLVASRVQGGVSDKLELDQAKTLVSSGARQPGPTGADPGADRKPDQFSAGPAPGRCHAREDSHRAAATTTSAGRPAFEFAGAPARSPRGRAGPDRGQRPGWCSQSCVLSQYQSHRSRRLSRAAICSALSVRAVSDIRWAAWWICRSSTRAVGGGTTRPQRRSVEELVATYQKAIDGAFRDVSDALIGYQKTREYSTNQMILTETLRDPEYAR